MYRVQLQHFEGPMDLLLFFIRRDELDITDIPIADIADEYLAYVRLLERVDLDGVGDFIYMAALLINIKARMLLPTPETDEEGEPIDPRRELVERLLEYVRFKEASAQLDARKARRDDLFTRGDAGRDKEAVQDAHEVEVDATVYDLVQALGAILIDAPEAEPVVHEVAPLRYTPEEQQRYVLRRILREERVSFRALVRQRAKGFVIATFLAVLEMARQRLVHLALAAPDAADFHVERPADLPAAADPDALLARGPLGDGRVEG